VLSLASPREFNSFVSDSDFFFFFFEARKVLKGWKMSQVSDKIEKSGPPLPVPAKMSDMEDDFMCDDEEDYDLEYSEDSNSEPNVDLENQYYNSKALKEDDPKAALSSFQKVLELEGLKH